MSIRKEHGGHLIQRVNQYVSALGKCTVVKNQIYISEADLFLSLNRVQYPHGLESQHSLRQCLWVYNQCAPVEPFEISYHICQFLPSDLHVSESPHRSSLCLG